MCNESGTGDPKLQFYSNDSMSPIPVNVNINIFFFRQNWYTFLLEICNHLYKEKRKKIPILKVITTVLKGLFYKVDSNRGQSCNQQIIDT